MIENGEKISQIVANVVGCVYECLGGVGQVSE